MASKVIFFNFIYDVCRFEFVADHQKAIVVNMYNEDLTLKTLFFFYTSKILKTAFHDFTNRR